jgi:pimeloyl-ACP methyl ester carboxylesterase
VSELAAPPCDERYVEVNGFSTFVRRIGAGPPVLLVHALGGSLRGWRKVQSNLAESREVVAYDWRGHGNSDRPVEDYEMGDLGRDLADLVGLLGLDRPCLVGVAAGAGIALQAALDRPGTASGLVLASACSEVSPAVADGMVARGRQVCADGMEVAVEASVKGGFSTGFRRQNVDVVDAYRHGFLSNSAEDYARASRAFSRFNVTDRLADLDLPCLLLPGSEDPYFPPHNSREMAQRLARSEVRVLEGVSHFSHIEAPDQITRAVVDFLG